ncbi:MAG: GNAT family N-acetyltransferase [Eubacteriales bacterium]|nr:GNAT family N-acetyltransferase [Eubacteriales bacterium]
MILRPAQEADREAVNSLARQVHELHVNWRPDIFRPSAEFYNEKGFAKFFAEKLMYVAEANGEVAAYVRFDLRELNHWSLMPRKILYVEELCVAEPFRHQGIGRQLMLELREIAKERGCTDMELSAVPQNETAIRLYESLGFTVRHMDFQMKL